MDIDWMIVLAQIVNLLVLMWLLKRFLYKPIQRVIQGREEQIANRAAAAQARQAQADALQAEYERKVAAIEAERAELLDAARAEARTLRRTLLAEAADEAEKARSRYNESLDRERQSLENELGERLVDQACRMAGRIVSELSQTRLEDALIDAFEERVHGYVRRSAQRAHEPSLKARTTVRTSFALSEEQRARLIRLAAEYGSRSTGLKAEKEGAPEKAAADVDVTFEYDPSLILGVEIIAGGEAVSWSARDYVNEIRQAALLPTDGGATVTVQGEASGA